MTKGDDENSFNTLRGFIRGEEPDEPIYFAYSANARCVCTSAVQKAQQLSSGSVYSAQRPSDWLPAERSTIVDHPVLGTLMIRRETESKSEHSNFGDNPRGGRPCVAHQAATAANTGLLRWLIPGDSTPAGRVGRAPSIS